MVDAMLREAAHAYVLAHSIAKVGDVVTTTWGGWKKPARVRLTHIGAHLVCRWNGKNDWFADFEMEYFGQRLRADGAVPDKSGHLCLLNILTEDGRQWKPASERGGKYPGFNHAGLCWGTFRTQRTGGVTTCDHAQPLWAGDAPNGPQFWCTKCGAFQPSHGEWQAPKSGVTPTAPKRDYCTDPNNCRRCGAAAWDQANHHHAGIPIGTQQTLGAWERRRAYGDGNGGLTWDAAWKPCTEAEARRVNGLRTWEVRRVISSVGGTDGR